LRKAIVGPARSQRNIYAEISDFSIGGRVEPLKFPRYSIGSLVRRLWGVAYLPIIRIKDYKVDCGYFKIFCIGY